MWTKLLWFERLAAIFIIFMHTEAPIHWAAPECVGGNVKYGIICIAQKSLLFKAVIRQSRLQVDNKYDIMKKMSNLCEYYYATIWYTMELLIDKGINGII